MPLERAVIFTPAARFELLEAQQWYEDEVPGLEHRFRAELERVVARMQATPRQFPAVHKDVRRALLRRFPYSVMFLIEPDETLTVIACFHSSRDLLLWRQRT